MNNPLKLLIFSALVSLLAPSCSGSVRSPGSKGAAAPHDRGDTGSTTVRAVSQTSDSPFRVLDAPPHIVTSTITVDLPVARNAGLVYAARMLATAAQPISPGLRDSMVFALPSYGVHCVHSIIQSTMQGPLSQRVVSDWVRDVLARAGDSIRSQGLWCSYDRCVFLLEKCEGTVTLPDSLPGRVTGRVPPGSSYGMVYDAQDGSLKTGHLAVDGTGQFEFLVPPCLPGMKFREFTVFREEGGSRITPLVTGRMNCGRPVYFPIVDPGRVRRTDDVREAERQVFGLVNEYRALKGIAPLRWDDRLARAARAHSKVLTGLDRLYHVRPDGSTPVTRAQKAGYVSEFIGEDLAMSHKLVSLVLGWYTSFGHRDVMQEPEFTDGAVGMAEKYEDGYTYHYATLLTGARAK